MRIWYQSLFDGGRMPAYFAGLQERAKRVARPGVEVEFHGMPSGIYGDKLPSDVARHPYLMSLHVQFTLDNALRAEAAGYDVFAVGSVQDPGLEEARSFDGPRVWAYNGVEGATTDLRRVRYGDFNGDGRTDVLYVNGWGTDPMRMSVHVSSGSGFARYDWSPKL